MSNIQDELGNALSEVVETIQCAFGRFEIFFEHLRFYKAQKKLMIPSVKFNYFQAKTKDLPGDILTCNKETACEAARTALESAKT